MAEKCRVLVEEKKPLYRWYHTDKRIGSCRRTFRDYRPGDHGEPIFQKVVDEVVGISKMEVSLHVVSVQLANKFFSWDDIQPKVLAAIGEYIEMEVEVVEDQSHDSRSLPDPTDRSGSGKTRTARTRERPDASK